MGTGLEDPIVVALGKEPASSGWLPTMISGEVKQPVVMDLLTLRVFSDCVSALIGGSWST